MVTKAEAMLSLAALEGETFTLEAVALCLGVALEGEEFEAWIDFCDDYLAMGEDDEEVGAKLLVPAGDVAGSSLAVIGYPVEEENAKQKSRTVNRYRFAKPYLHLGWQKLQDVGGALLQERCEQLAEQLVAAYTPHLQLVLDALTRLYEAAENRSGCGRRFIRLRWNTRRMWWHCTTMPIVL
ncbi:MAG: hypothetical protein IPL28_26090 [Chloroflexi bacterium]|nr:hypothetical protein [Chloroflexota bacterium]